MGLIRAHVSNLPHRILRYHPSVGPYYDGEGSSPVDSIVVVVQ